MTTQQINQRLRRRFGKLGQHTIESPGMHSACPENSARKALFGHRISVSHDAQFFASSTGTTFGSYSEVAVAPGKDRSETPYTDSSLRSACEKPRRYFAAAVVRDARKITERRNARHHQNASAPSSLHSFAKYVHKSEGVRTQSRTSREAITGSASATSRKKCRRC